MQGGRVHQVASPTEIYSRPATLFVGSFVGTMNVFDRVPVGPGGEVTIGSEKRTVPALAGRSLVTLAVRPEDVAPSFPDANSPAAIKLDGAVDKVTYAGREAFYRWSDVTGVRLLLHVFRPDAGKLAAVGERLSVEIPLARLHAFEPADGRRIGLTQ